LRFHAGATAAGGVSSPQRSSTPGVNPTPCTPHGNVPDSQYGDFLFNMPTAFYSAPIQARIWRRIVCIIVFSKAMMNTSITMYLLSHGRGAGMFTAYIYLRIFLKKSTIVMLMALF
jgi:hypothetical protein